MNKYLADEEAIAKLSTRFLKQSNGLMIVAIGTLDGMFVCIVRPGWRDSIKNAMSFFL